MFFFGVPYAEPPVNKLRFKRSKLIKKFSFQPFYADQFRPHCEQARSKKYGDNAEFSEDCLYMNLYIPNLESNKVNGICKKKYNVMLYVYGGKSSIYQEAKMKDKDAYAPLSYSGELFAALHDTIFVAFNYRQELFSSLYLEDEFKGNLALWDQNLALQWTKKHINQFCGDDQSITIFGNSLGSLAIGYHLISIHSNHLISNVIMQSFSPLFRSVFPISKK